MSWPRTLLALTLLVMTATSGDARSYPWLGVRIRDLSEQEADDLSARHGVQEGLGVYIVDVIDGAPAARSGLKRGDVVVAVNGRPIVETRLLQRLVGAQDVGGEARLTVLRPEGRREVVVRLALMPPVVAGERTAADFGFIMRETEGATPERGGGGLDGPTAVAAVLGGTPAERAGLAVGDVILEVNGRTVPGGTAVREALADVDPGRPLHLTVRRDAESRSLTLVAP